jgi:hypothetical protein
LRTALLEDTTIKCIYHISSDLSEDPLIVRFTVTLCGTKNQKKERKEESPTD